MRSVFQPNSTPSLDAFAGFHFHRPSTKHALLLGKPICGRVDPDTPILGLTPTSAQQNFVRLPYFQNYKTDELTVSNWTDTSMHRNHTGNGGALTDVTEESAANARVPDSTLALCCIDFFMAEPGTGPDQLFVEDLSDPALQSRPAERKRIPKERVDARLLCQTTRSIGGAWTGMSAIAPWTLASDGSIRPTIDQTNYTWPRALGTGLNRAPIGWMNETDVAFLVTSEEAHQAGRGVMVHATASIAVDALAPLKSLVRDADVQLVNTTMRGRWP